jgi:NAD(P)-dependent dehydrogenase (short-subunit alcohol dehydrogenase family)
MQAQSYGRIVTVASIAGKEGNPNAAAYSASKAGVIALTKSLGKEHAGENIAVNCVTLRAFDEQIRMDLIWTCCGILINLRDRNAAFHESCSQLSTDRIG